MKTSNKYSGRQLKKPDMKQKGNFTQIPNSFILNPEITDSELRLLQYILMYSNYRVIKIKDCIGYLNKTKPSIYSAFEGLINLGILKITDDTIEVMIPEEMNKYKLGYLKEIENNIDEVKKTLPTESDKASPEGKENFTITVKKSLPSSKENLTKKVKNSYDKSLECNENECDTGSVILYNNRVLPVPAKSGSTEQSHSNYNTKANLGVKLDLECDELQSQASPSVLAPSHHTPKKDIENKDKESLPINDDFSDILPFVDNTIPTQNDIRQPNVKEKQIEINNNPKVINQVVESHQSNTSNINSSVSEETNSNNSIPTLLKHNDTLKEILYPNYLEKNEFNIYQDKFIAQVVLAYQLSKVDTNWKERYQDLDYNKKHLGVFIYACRAAIKVDFKTDLLNELYSQSNLEYKELFNVLFGYNPQ